MKQSNEKGFTLFELVVVLIIVQLVVTVAVANLRSMHDEGRLTKAEAELQTIKTAVVSYWRNFGNTYPSNIHSDLMSTSPAVTTAVVPDPFETDTTTLPATYGYVTDTDPEHGPYFAIWTKGPKGDTTTVNWNSTTGKIEYYGTGRVTSNVPVVKLSSPP